jgi:hypothetical protein
LNAPLIRGVGPILLAALLATPATARTLEQRIHDLPTSEWVYQGIGVADFASTEICLRRDTCRESNPLFGHHPKTAVLFVGNVVVGGIAHAAVTSALQDHAPGLVKPWEIITIGLHGGLVVANLRFAF